MMQVRSQSIVRDMGELTRLRFVTGTLIFLVTISLGLLLIDILDAQAMGEGGITLTTALLIITVLAGAIGIYFLYQGEFTGTITNLTTVYVALLTITATDDVELLAVLMLAFITNALLSGRLTYRLVTALLIGRILLHMDAQVGGFTTLAPGTDIFLREQVPLLVGIVLVGAVPLFLGASVRVFTYALRTTVIEAQRTASLLEASAAVGQVMARYLTLNELLNQAVTIIRDRFGFYHVQIFIVDELEQFAQLTASTGEVGKELLERGHRLPVNSRSIVGRTIQAGEPVVARDTTASADHAFNPLLPNTRAELGVPIMDGNRVIGAVDIQSTRVEAFTAIEIQALQVMAGQLATAIRNVRLFEEQEANVRENQRLLMEAETNLREIQRLNRQLTGQAWTEYLVNNPISGVTLMDKRLRPGAEWTEAMKQASQKRRAIVETHDDKRVVSVPIELRNEIVGALEVELDDQHTEDEAVDLLMAVANRLALSLDNARLFEETQEISMQEQRLNDLVAQYQSADSVDELLQFTLQGLAEALGAEHGAIRLGGTLKQNGASGHGGQG